MTLEKTIKKAVEGGWKNNHKAITLLKGGVQFGEIENEGEILLHEQIFLDPLFWQYLGKAMGWEKQFNEYSELETKRLLEKGALIPRWLYRWHCFIDHLAESKSPKTFFENL